ncbi:MAG TPA: glycosyltransferase family 39 protein [Desulfovibrio sp.]|uniref:ArnT family glycosyltransferase n=1 Tax=Desulfovibrio sp. TaxID=885 RepID=UPI002C44F7EC|nr:glycosyltransferase family 39 protein [Desulfovibrio sp.]HMM38440.1 glycosyltransferase family 39 protein [Desulfovibrio sp.]
MTDPTFSDRRRWLMLLLLFAASVAVRILTAEYVDIGGDNATRWMQVHRLAEGLGYTAWTHQTVRWTIAMPLWALMKLFGTHPALYYVLPILFASLGTVFVYLIGEEIHGRRLGIAAAVLTMLFPQMAQSGSQIWPSIFIFASVAASIWLILAWLRRRSPMLLILAGAAFFLAWGARETAAYFFPGLLLLIWLPSRSLKGVALFCLSSGLLFGCEWLYFWHDTGSLLGKMGVTKTALDERPGMTPLTWATYFLNILDYEKLRGLVAVLVLSLVAAVAELRSPDQRRRALAIITLLFNFFSTYMLSSISSPQFVHPIGSRYWCAGAPFGLISLLLWLTTLKTTRPRTATACSALLFGAFAIFSVFKIPPTNSIVQISRDAEILMPMLAEKRPFTMRYLAWQPNAVERLFIGLATGKAQKERKPKQIPLSMARGLDRVAALFVSDVRSYDDFADAPMTPLDEALWLVTPVGAPPGSTPGAEVIFDRRLCRAERLEPSGSQ